MAHPALRDGQRYELEEKLQQLRAGAGEVMHDMTINEYLAQVCFELWVRKVDRYTQVGV